MLARNKNSAKKFQLAEQQLLYRCNRYKLPSMTLATKHDLEAKLFFGCFVEKWLAYESRVYYSVCEHGCEGACVHSCVCVCLSVLKTLCI